MHLCLCQLSPFTAKPSLSLEKGLKRERGRGRWRRGVGRQSTEEGGGGSDRKREAERRVSETLWEASSFHIFYFE